MEILQNSLMRFIKEILASRIVLTGNPPFTVPWVIPFHAADRDDNRPLCRSVPHRARGGQ